MAPDRRCSLEGQLDSAREAMTALRRTLGCPGAADEPRERPWWQDNPAGVLAVLRTWWVTPKMAARFAERFCPAAEFVVIGHTHRPGVWTRRGRTVVNTGSFVRMSRAYVVRWARGVLGVRETFQKNGRYFAGRDVVTFPVGIGAA
jgi:hypothetical protein